MSQEQSGRRNTWKVRGWVASVVVVGLAATVGVRWFARQRSLDFFRDDLMVTAQNISADLEAQVRMAGALVESLAAFFENTTDQTEAEFNTFAARAARESPGLFAASWQAWVPGATRASFETATRAVGHPDFQIVDRRNDGGLNAAPERDVYLPITFMYAPRGDGPARGLDLTSYDVFMAPKWRALESGDAAASQLIRIPLGAPGEETWIAGFSLSSAVLRPGEQPVRERLRGFTSATFLLETMLRAATAGHAMADLRVSLRDGVTADGLQYDFSGAAVRGADSEDLEPFVDQIELFGRTWTLHVTPTASFVSGLMARMPDIVSGVGLCATLGIALLVAHRLAERRRRRQVDIEHRAAERKFHEVVENMAGAVTVFGANDAGREFVVWDMNAAALALAHPGDGEIIGRPLAAVFGPELHANVHEAMRRVWVTGQAEKLPTFAHVRAGHVRWLGCNVFRLGSGEIVTVCHDLTSQKEIEQELRQARAELEVALDASRVGLWSWDMGLECARLDPRSAAILDVGDTEVLRPVDLEERVHPEDYERLRAEAVAAITNAKEFESEVRFGTRDGSWRRLCLRARPTPGADGSVRQIVGCVWDATERRNEEDSRQQRQRLESVATLAGGIAHDLNNALAPLTMGLDLLRLRLGGDAESAETLQSMAASTRRAAAIVKQLGGLARGGAEVAIAAQPRRILETLREQLRESFPPGITVDVRVPGADLPAIQAGRRPLHQVLLNLCVNAREAMRGQGSLTIEARAVHIGPGQRGEYPDLTQGAYVAFTVQDTGPGIPAAIRSRIFDPFFTTKAAGRGTGLGLATALSIVRSVRGTIRIDTREGEGARCTVVVPVALERVQAVAERANGSSSSGVTLRGKTVLLADDEPMVREVARRVLETAGMRVLVAQDGREAIDLFERHATSIDVVVLDLVMPDVDGPTAGATIRELRADVPMVGASGYAAETVLEKARGAGFTSFLPKPYTMDGLLDAVRGVLKRPVGVGSDG